MSARAHPYDNARIEIFEDGEDDYDTHRKHFAPAYQTPVPFDAHLHSLT